MGKKKEALPVPTIVIIDFKNRNDVSKAIKDLGDHQRSIQELEIETDKQIAELTESLSKKKYPLNEKINVLAHSIKHYSDTNREELFPELKTFDFLTGKISYRNGKLSVTTKLTGKFLQKLFGASNSKLNISFKILTILCEKIYLKIGFDIDKSKILDSKENIDAAKKLGYEVETGKERFYIKPFETEKEVEL